MINFRILLTLQGTTAANTSTCAAPLFRRRGLRATRFAVRGQTDVRGNVRHEISIFPHTMMKIRHRAYAYITNGNRLLLFTHPESPEAGIQVPAGTIEPGESPEDAVMREAREETGLTELKYEKFLAQDTRDMRDCGVDELQYRWFYHLSVGGRPRDTWRQGELAEDGSVRIPFDFFWANVRALPKLVANYDDKIDLLIESMDALQ